MAYEHDRKGTLLGRRGGRSTRGTRGAAFGRLVRVLHQLVNRLFELVDPGAHGVDCSSVRRTQASTGHVSMWRDPRAPSPGPSRNVLLPRICLDMSSNRSCCQPPKLRVAHSATTFVLASTLLPC